MNISAITTDVKSLIRPTIARDLQPSFNRRAVILLVAGIGGGLASLTVCGQFGLGLTSWARTIGSHIHQTTSPWQCAAICGVLFAIFPVVLLRLVTSPMFFHVLVARHFAQVATFFGATGALIAILGHHGNTLSLFAMWILAAVGTIWCTGRILRDMTPQFQLFRPAIK